MADRVVLAHAGGSEISAPIRWTADRPRSGVAERRSAGSVYDFSMATHDAGDTVDHSPATGPVDRWGLPTTRAAARGLGAGRGVS